MATSGGDPQRRKTNQGGVSGGRGGAQSVLVRSEKERWSSFPMGQRLTGPSTPTSSTFLLQQIVHHRYTESEPGQEETESVAMGEEEELTDSEESSESELLNLEGEFDGVLREEAVAEALYHLGRSGPGTEQVFLNLTLSGCDLIDISILCGYVHLQTLDLSVNKIGDLSCVSCMPYLLELNASQNRLTTFFNFKPPKNLKKVDFSCNQISKMGDLSAYQALTKLILDSNAIEEISGLELCSSLTHLSLAKNKITTISGLGELPIKILCLSHNQIEKIVGLEQLRSLKIVDLSYNQIKSLQGLENHDFLEVINLEDNKISELGEIEYIENLPLLRILNLLKNPIQEHCEYWFFIIFMLLRLTELDQKNIKVEEKVLALNKYNPPPEVVAAQDHLTHVVHSVMQPQRIFDSTLPSLDAPYPMLVLVGPEACGKRELAHRLCRQFSTYFRYGACHTSRPPYFGEGDRVDYQFVSEEDFNKMVNMGKFILTYNYNDHNYGLSRDTIEGIARDGLASCVHMEIEGVRSLKLTYFEPRYILVLPLNKKKYEGHLRRKGLFSRVEIDFAVSRVDHYIKINQKSPGFFDAVINADDMDAAYQQLSQLVQEYLGLGEDTAPGLAPPADVKRPSRKVKKPAVSCDVMDSTDRNFFMRLWTKFSTKKTPVSSEEGSPGSSSKMTQLQRGYFDSKRKALSSPPEEGSVERQYEAARQALMGKTPPHFTLLFQRGSVPAPLDNTHYASVSELQKIFEICEESFKIPFKHGWSSMDTHGGKYSELFQSCPWLKELPFESPGVSDTKDDKSLKAPQKMSLQYEKVFLQHRRHTISLMTHPGSNIKPSLPSIPQGRKYNSS